MKSVKVFVLAKLEVLVRAHNRSIQQKRDKLTSERHALLKRFVDKSCTDGDARHDTSWGSIDLNDVTGELCFRAKTELTSEQHKLIKAVDKQYKDLPAGISMHEVKAEVELALAVNDLSGKKTLLDANALLGKLAKQLGLEA